MSANNTARIAVLLDNEQANAAAKTTSKEIDGIGEAGKRAGVSASAGLSQAERTTGQLLLRQQQLTQEITRLNAAIKAESIALAEMQRLSGTSAAMQQQLSGKIAESEKTLIGMLEAKRSAARESGNLEKQIGKTDSAFNQLTSRINVGRGALSGWDSVIEGVVRAGGGIQLQWAVLIGLASVLLPKIIDLISAKRELAKVDSDYVALLAFNATNGNLVVQMNNEQSRSAAALTGAIIQVVENQRKLNEEVERGKALQKGLETATDQTQRSATAGLRGYDEVLVIAACNTRRFQDAIAKSQETQAGFTKEIIEGLKSLDGYRAITHQGTAAVIEFARSQKFTNDELVVLKQALDEDVRKMSEFATEAAKAATHTRSLAEATIAFNIARATAPAPGFSNPQFATGADTAKFVEEVSQNLTVAVQQGAMFREAVLSQEGALRSIQKHFRETTLTVAGYNAEIAKLPDNVRRGLIELEQIQKGMKVFADHTKQAESATKALTIATAELNAKLETAKAARDQAMGISTSFAQQEANVRTAISLKRKELEEKNQLTALNKVRLVDLEAIELATIGAKRTEAERQIQERLGQIREAAEAKASGDKIARLQVEISKRYDAEVEFVKKAGISQVQQEEYLRDVRTALVTEYLGRRKQLEDAAEKVTRQQRIETERIITGIIEEEELKRSQAILKAARDNAQARVVLGRFLLSQGQGASSGETDAFIAQLKKLGDGFQDVDKNAQTARTAIDYVRNSFGFASQSAEMFHLKLDLLTGGSVTFGQTFKAIVAEMFTTVGGLTSVLQTVGNAVAGVFEGIVTGTENAKAAFLEFLAGLLMQIGQAAIAMGTIYLFMPGFQGLGVALIAAGIAAMALGGVLKGLASNARKSGESSAGGGAASSGGGSVTHNEAPPPNVIAFPTSGGLNRNQPVVIGLDRMGTRDFLEGRRVITHDDLENTGSSASRKIKKIAS